MPIHTPHSLLLCSRGPFWPVQDGKRGVGAAAVFVARNRFAVLDKASNQILVKNLRNEVTKQCASPLPVTDNIFYAGTGMLLCRSDDKVGPPSRPPRPSAVVHHAAHPHMHACTQEEPATFPFQ